MVAPFAERRLFARSSGHVGLAPPGARIGDMVAFMQRGKVPFVIRFVSNIRQSASTLVGDAYVDGLMYGEIGTLNLDLEVITLV